MNYRCHSVTNEIKSTNALSISQFFLQGYYSAVDGDEKEGKWSNFLVRVVCNAVLEYLGQSRLLLQHQQDTQYGLLVISVFVCCNVYALTRSPLRTTLDRYISGATLVFS